MKSKKIKFGSIATAFTVLFIVAVVVLNILATFLTDRFALRADMTDARIFDITDQTKQYLAELKEEITITVLAPESLYEEGAVDATASGSLRPVKEILTRYEALSGGRVTVRYVDPYTNGDIVSKYNTLSNLNRGDIIVESDRRFKRVQPSSLYSWTQDPSQLEQQVTGIQAEQTLTSAIAYCVMEKLPKALNIIGHDEESLRSLNSILTSGNYDLSTINILTEEIPDDCSMIIINKPKADYSDADINKLDAYFARGGNAMIFLDLEIKSLPVLERYIAEWGVKFESMRVADAERAIGNQPNMLAPIPDASHEITKGLAGRGQYLLSPDTRALTILYDQQNWRSTYPLLYSSSESYGKYVTAGSSATSVAREAGDPAGPFDICVLTEDANAGTPGAKVSRILFASTGLALDDVLDNDTFRNSAFFARALNYMGANEDTILVEPIYFTSSTLSIIRTQVMGVFWVLVVAIPVVILGTGTFVWIKRRNM
ncbi:GldG family protein [Oscillospiraceae bacterium OttesenSCG-928-F05]|nr:GldG family protein [Oscillospiraceae bacterium OttesenSCG-928-F05]